MSQLFYSKWNRKCLEIKSKKVIKCHNYGYYLTGILRVCIIMVSIY